MLRFSNRNSSDEKRDSTITFSNKQDVIVEDLTTQTPTPAPTPRSSFKSEEASGLSSKMDVHFDPKTATVDCSCGLRMFRRKNN